MACNPPAVRAVRQRVGDATGAIALVASNPGLRRLELAWAGSMIGTWAYGIALIVYAYGAGGATAVGVVGFLRWTAAAVAAPFTGLLGDRLARTRVMVASDAARAVALAAAAAAAAADLPYVVYALAVVVSVASTAFRPAQAALVPGLARTPEELTAANVTATTIESVGIFAGPALGGLLLAASSSAVVFGVTAGAMVWSALLVVRISEPAREPATAPAAASVGAEVAAGFRTILREGRVRLLVALFAAQTFVDGAMNVLVVVASLQLLDLGRAGVGYLNSAMGVGGVIGALAAFSLAGRLRLAPSFGLGIAIWGVPIALIGVFPHAALALVLFGCVGIGNTLVDVAGTTLLQRSAPDAVLARVFGVLESLIVGSIGIGALVAPFVVHALGIRWALVAFGVFLPAVVAVTWRTLVAIDGASPAPAGLDLLRGIPFLAPLPAPTLEALAGRLERVRVPAGATIVERGDRGDRFYVIADGEVEVAAEEQVPSVERRGGYFGEIALLRDVPRTATVKARTDTELLALEGPDFVAAVTGAPSAHEAAEAVVGARLGVVVPV
jgi:MFS family permease